MSEWICNLGAFWGPAFMGILTLMLGGIGILCIWGFCRLAEALPEGVKDALKVMAVVILIIAFLGIVGQSAWVDFCKF